MKNKFVIVCLIIDRIGIMSEEVIKAIEDIIKRGNDAEIRRKGDGYVVLEVKKTIKYTTPA